MLSVFYLKIIGVVLRETTTLNLNDKDHTKRLSFTLTKILNRHFLANLYMDFSFPLNVYIAHVSLDEADVVTLISSVILTSHKYMFSQNFVSV